MHLDDEISNLWLNARSSRAPRSAVPAPVQAEALSVPADHGLPADKEESLTPSRPKARKPGPEHPVGGLKRDAPFGALALLDEQLVTKRENLSLELGARPQRRSNRSQKSQKGRPRHRRHVDPARQKHQSFQCGREFGRHRRSRWRITDFPSLIARAGFAPTARAARPGNAPGPRSAHG